MASSSGRKNNDHKIDGNNNQPLLESDDVDTHLLSDAISSSIHNDPLIDSGTQDIASTRTVRYWCVTLLRCMSMVYIVLGLIVFAMGLFWRTRSFIALLGPLTCLCVVLVASEYYHVKRSKIQCGTKLHIKQHIIQ